MEVEIRYSAHNSLPLVNILNHMNPVQQFRVSFPSVNATYLPMPTLPRGLFPSDFLT